jgi:chromosomal replication initiation ATPase DnaA
MTVVLLLHEGVDSDAILAAAARRCNVPVSGLRSPRRDTPLARARWVAMLALAYRGCSSVTIGRLLLRHHSTVLHGLARAQTDPALATAAAACAWTWNEVAGRTTRGKVS